MSGDQRVSATQVIGLLQAQAAGLTRVAEVLSEDANRLLDLAAQLRAEADQQQEPPYE